VYKNSEDYHSGNLKEDNNQKREESIENINNKSIASSSSSEDDDNDDEKAIPFTVHPFKHGSSTISPIVPLQNTEEEHIQGPKSFGVPANDALEKQNIEGNTMTSTESPAKRDLTEDTNLKNHEVNADHVTQTKTCDASQFDVPTTSKTSIKTKRDTEGQQHAENHKKHEQEHGHQNQEGKRDHVPDHESQQKFSNVKTENLHEEKTHEPLKLKKVSKREVETTEDDNSHECLENKKQEFKTENDSKTENKEIKDNAKLTHEPINKRDINESASKSVPSDEKSSIDAHAPVVGHVIDPEITHENDEHHTSIQTKQNDKEHDVAAVVPLATSEQHGPQPAHFSTWTTASDDHLTTTNNKNANINNEPLNDDDDGRNVESKRDINKEEPSHENYKESEQKFSTIKKIVSNEQSNHNNNNNNNDNNNNKYFAENDKNINNNADNLTKTTTKTTTTITHSDKDKDIYENRKKLQALTNSEANGYNNPPLTSNKNNNDFIQKPIPIHDYIQLQSSLPQENSLQISTQNTNTDQHKQPVVPETPTGTISNHKRDLPNIDANHGSDKQFSGIATQANGSSSLYNHKQDEEHKNGEAHPASIQTANGNLN